MGDRVAVRLDVVGRVADLAARSMMFRWLLGIPIGLFGAALPQPAERLFMTGFYFACGVGVFAVLRSTWTEYRRGREALRRAAS
jgi:hypothetical protein